MSEMVVIDALLPLAIDTLYTYRIDDKNICSNIAIGSFIAVPIGKKKIVGAIAIAIRDIDSEAAMGFRPVAALLSEKAIVSQMQLDFWHWLSSYYLLPLGSIAYNFLPPSLKLSTQYTTDSLGEISYEFSSIFGRKEVAELKLNPIYNTTKSIESLLDSLKRAKKREELLCYILEEIESKNDLNYPFYLKDIQSKGHTLSTITELVKSGVLLKEKILQEIDYSLPKYIKSTQPEHENIGLTEKFNNSWVNKPTILFESQNHQYEESIICQKIDKTLSKGGKILFLTPIINLSNRYIELFKEKFGTNLVVFDKKKSKGSQHQQYSTILSTSEALLVVATRNGVGLPFSDLDLVIVEREHDQLYLGSQHEMSFNGRDAAIYLAYLHKAETILISAAPSIETLYNCENGKYDYFAYKQNFSSKVVAIERNNIARDERKLYQSSTHRRFLSKYLIDEIDKRTTNGEMVFLYQNRKGFATVMECAECGEYKQCDNCNTTLTYFKTTDSLNCRYCGSSYNKQIACKACGSYNFREQGVGTENVEERIKELFPLLKVIRIDAESAKSRENFVKAITAIKNREVDVIIGTQIMLSLPKPDNLTLIGVINGDNLFTMPDHRANERAFQLLTQLRMMLSDEKTSLFVVQMSQHMNFLKNFTSNNYRELYINELKDRKEFGYPPFCKIITFQIENSDLEKLEKVADELVLQFRHSLNAKILDPVTPIVDKIRGNYIREVILKCYSWQALPLIKSQSLSIAASILKKIKWRVSCS